MMYRTKPSTLSILERAQGQLSGKRFVKKSSTNDGSHQREEEPEEEEDELKAYLSQLQKRTTKKGLNDDIVDEVYQPKTSTPITSGSLFLKSNRANKSSPAQTRQPPSEDRARRDVTTERRKPSDEMSDVSDRVSSNRPSISEEEVGYPMRAGRRWKKPIENLAKASTGENNQESPKRGGPGLQERMTAVRAKSAAYDRIMSNFVSDEDDVEDLINSVESDTPRKADYLPAKNVDVPTKAVDVSIKKSSFNVDSPPPNSVSQSPAPPISEDVQEVASLSECIPTDISDSSHGDMKLNIFQAEDLQPAILNKAENQTSHGITEKTDKPHREGKYQRSLPPRKQAWLQDSQKVKRKVSLGDPVDSEEINSDSESEINTITESDNNSIRESDRTRSDEDTDVIANSYSSITSRQSRASPSHSSRTCASSKHSSDSDVSTRKTTPRNYRGSRATSPYSDDFDSDTRKSRAVSSSETLTPTVGATSNHSPTTLPATPTPSPTQSLKETRTRRVKDTPKETRTRRVKDIGVQTSSNNYNQGHWILDHAPRRQGIDVSKLLKDFKTTSVAPEALHAVSSVDYTSLLLHQTLKMQYRQTQQSIERMLQLHQSLLESVQPDYVYTTLEDTKAYIQHQRENGKR